MRRLVLALAALFLLRADMYQDGSNAKLPDARQNLELGTVKSEGGTPPNKDSVTRFYSHEGGIQFGVGSNIFANEYAIEQAGLGAPGGVGIGQGATRTCTAPFFNSAVNCNYVAEGRDGKHLFGSGAGTIAEFQYGGSGAASHGWLKFSTSENDGARIETVPSWVGYNIDLDIKANGYGSTTFSNGQGKIAKISSATVGPTNAWPALYGANDGQVRISADGTATDVSLFLSSKGIVPVYLSNAGNNIAFYMTAGVPALVRAPDGVYIDGQRVPTRQTIGAYTIPVVESGYHYHNQGAPASSTYTLPLAAQGLNYCVSVDAAFSVILKASGSDRIAVGATNSAAGGQVSSAAPFASICVVAYKAGQWITRSTADKTQWTVT